MKCVRAAGLVACLAACWGSVGLGAAEVAGVKLEDRLTLDSGALVLNGAGLRSRLFVKVYVAGLYLPQKTSEAGAIVQVNGPRRVHMRMLRNLDAQTLAEALEEGVRNNSSTQEQAALKPALDELMAQMRKLGSLKENDSVVMDFSPQLVRVIVNGQASASVSSPVLPAAMLRVWLGENPVDKSLKAALLGVSGS